MTDDIELPDDEIVPDETQPIEDPDIKTDPIPEEESE